MVETSDPPLTVPEAVAGPTAFRALSSAMAARTSGRREKAVREQSSTAAAALDASSCCSRGRKDPLWGQRGGGH